MEIFNTASYTVFNISNLSILFIIYPLYQLLVKHRIFYRTNFKHMRFLHLALCCDFK